MTKRPNANAGKGVRYSPDPAAGPHTSDRFRASPGAGTGPNANVPTQAHARGSASGRSPQDKSSRPANAGSPPAASAGNALPHGGGVRTVHLPPGDLPRRRIR